MHNYYLLVLLLLATAPPLVHGQDPHEAETSDRSSDRETTDASFDLLTNYGPLELSLQVDGIKRSLQMVINTGASTTVFDQRHRHLLGATTGVSAVAMRDSVSSLERCALGAARIGGFVFPDNASVLVADLSTVDEDLGSEYDGVIGMDFLRDKVLQINFDRKQLRLLSSVPADPGTAAPMRYDDSGIPQVLVRVGERDAEWALVITDMFQSGVTPTAMLDLIERKQVFSLKMFGLSDRSKQRGVLCRASSFSIGQCQEKGSELVTSYYNSVGLEFLTHFDVVMDFKDDVLYLRPNARSGRLSKEDAFGAQIVKRNGMYLIRDIKAGSVAACAGMLPGDILLRVDGCEISQLRLPVVRCRFNDAERELNIQIKRGGETIDLRLRPEPNLKAGAARPVSP